MLDSLRRPLTLPVLIAGVLAAALLVALYCVGYSRLSGQDETLAESLGWAIVNICPWLVALEAAKRATGWAGAAAIIGCGGLLFRPARLAPRHRRRATGVRDLAQGSAIRSRRSHRRAPAIRGGRAAAVR